MIDHKKKDGGLIFLIGKTAIPVSHMDAVSMGHILRPTPLRHPMPDKHPMNFLPVKS
jgi:hypothetical protein